MELLQCRISVPSIRESALSESNGPGLEQSDPGFFAPQGTQGRTSAFHPLLAFAGEANYYALGACCHWMRDAYRSMTKFLISFPSEAMALSEEEFPIVSAEAHAVIEEAKAAGVYVFGGGIEEQVDPVLVSADGTVSNDIYPGSRLDGGFTVLELPTREDAVNWARKIAAACRCSQELREFMYDPAS